MVAVSAVGGDEIEDGRCMHGFVAEVAGTFEVVEEGIWSLRKAGLTNFGSEECHSELVLLCQVCGLFVHAIGIMALCSRSPPGTLGTQGSIRSKNSYTATEIEAIRLGPQTHHQQLSRSTILGSVPSLSHSNASRFSHHTSHSSSDVLDVSSSNSCSVGSHRSISRGEAIHSMMAWESDDPRSGSGNLSSPISSRMRERSPVLVLRGPISRNGCALLIHSALGSVSCGGIPHLDPHVERELSRRSPHSGERGSPIVASSVGFKIGNTDASPDYQRALASLNQPTESGKAVYTSSESFRVEGFSSGASVHGNSSRVTLSLPLYSSGRNCLSTSQRDAAPDILEAREKIVRLAEQVINLPSVGTEDLTKVNKSASPTADELLRSAQARYKAFYDPIVVKAFRMAEEAHKGQFRRNGDMFLAHCVETALILAATGVGNIVVAAGLLHDAIDDSNLSLELLRCSLGENVASLVIGVSKLSEFSQLARDCNTVCDTLEADRLRTMILAMVDVRVVLIKIADRLHNLRTLEALPSHKQIGIAKETLEIFAPLANRLGIWSWKAEMEDLCFKCLKPVDHENLSIRLSERCREGLVMSSIRDLDEALRVGGVQFIDLCGRPKNLYSVYKKMMKKKEKPR